MTDPTPGPIPPDIVHYLRAGRHRALTRELTEAADDIQVVLAKLAAGRLTTRSELVGITHRLVAAAMMAAEINAFDSIVPAPQPPQEVDHDPATRS